VGIADIVGVILYLEPNRSIEKRNGSGQVDVCELVLLDHRFIYFLTCVDSIFIIFHFPVSIIWQVFSSHSAGLIFNMFNFAVLPIQLLLLSGAIWQEMNANNYLLLSNLRVSLELLRWECQALKVRSPAIQLLTASSLRIIFYRFTDYIDNVGWRAWSFNIISYCLSECTLTGFSLATSLSTHFIPDPTGEKAIALSKWFV